jgi:ATP-dependent DNA helicase RecG
MNIADKLDLKNLSILEQFYRSMDFFQKHIQVSERINGPYRETIEEVPIVAYREAVSNAIVHRDYMHPGAIKVEFFNDRIEITSPGGLPPNITEEEYIDGRISIIRNRVVTDIFLRLNIIEKLATGIRRIKEHYVDNVQKPVFDVKQNSIRIILPKNQRSDLDNSEKMSNQVNEREVHVYTKNLLQNENLIIEYIFENGSITRHEAESLLFVKKTQTVKILNLLIEKNLITKVSKGKNIRYLLKRKQ